MLLPSHPTPSASTPVQTPIHAHGLQPGFVAFTDLSLIYVCSPLPLTAVVPYTALGNVTLGEPVTVWLALPMSACFTEPVPTCSFWQLRCVAAVGFLAWPHAILQHAKAVHRLRSDGAERTARRAASPFSVCSKRV